MSKANSYCLLSCEKSKKMDIVMYFPSEIVEEILMWLNIDEFSPVFSVSKLWNKLGTSERIWKTFYYRRYLVSNPSSHPLHQKPSLSASMVLKFSYLLDFQERLRSPRMGDLVEVAWRGKFRLEGPQLYQGLAWWRAQVVDTHASQRKYKVRYPGWDARWDEWVPLSRLRWAVAANTCEALLEGDAAELWCCGASVPGAWLETRVLRIGERDGVRENSRDNRDRGDEGEGMCLVENVLTSGHEWVERSRLRKRKSKAQKVVVERVNSGERSDSRGNSERTPSRDISRELNEHLLTGFSGLSGLSGISGISSLRLTRTNQSEESINNNNNNVNNVSTAVNNNNTNNNINEFNEYNSPRRQHSFDAACGAGCVIM